MRTELEASGIPLPDSTQLLNLSDLFNMRIGTALGKDVDGKALTTASLALFFSVVDLDGSGFVTFDELRRVARSRLGGHPPGLGISSSKVSDHTLSALWVALDADDSDQVHVDELYRFFRGQVTNFVRAKGSNRVLAGKASRKEDRAKALQKLEEEAEERRQLAAARAAARDIPAELEQQRREMREAEKKEEARYMKQREAQMNAKHAAKQRKKQEVESLRSTRREVGMQHMQYKQRMLSEMRLQILKTPISSATRDTHFTPIYDFSTNKARNENAEKGGGRIVPLYESERLAARMERGAPRKWRWPGAPPISLGTQWTEYHDNLSRLDNLLSSPSRDRALLYGKPRSPSQFPSTRSPKMKLSASLPSFPVTRPASSGREVENAVLRSGEAFVPLAGQADKFMPKDPMARRSIPRLSYTRDVNEIY